MDYILSKLRSLLTQLLSDLEAKIILSVPHVVSFHVFLSFYIPCRRCSADSCCSNALSFFRQKIKHVCYVSRHHYSGFFPEIFRQYHQYYARISRKDKIRNNIIKQKINVTRSVLEDIKIKQLQLYGHVQRM